MQPKFTLKGAQHRVQKRDILLDVVIAEEEVKDYPVAWVKLRGSEDPIYQKAVAPHALNYNDEVDQAKDDLKSEEDQDRIRELTGVIKKALIELMVHSVSCAIVDWDEEFFGTPFSQEAAVEIFKDDANNAVYNQIAEYMRKREDFLPVASVPQ